METESELNEDNNLTSNASAKSEETIQSNEINQNGDLLPKSFLQLKGIIVGNFNMGCNFHISAAICIMIQYVISILAIQEHTAWSRILSDNEISQLNGIAINGDILR
jgi:hypothetical protein